MRRARERAGVSQQRLAELSGVHHTEISLLERAARDPQISTIVRLARSLGVAPAELVDEPEAAAAATAAANLLPNPVELPPREQFTANLRRHRRRSGLSQEALAQHCGLHRAEISRLERGEREPRLSTIVRHAKALEIAPAALLEGVR